MYNLEVHATSAHHALHTLHAFYSLHLCSTPAGMHADSTHFGVTRRKGHSAPIAVLFTEGSEPAQVYRLRGERNLGKNLREGVLGRGQSGLVGIRGPLAPPLALRGCGRLCANANIICIDHGQ